MNAVTRPVLRWHGGKWRLAPWIIAHLPPHRCYVEPFGGAASVLLRKARAHAEIYNDLDDEAVNLFRVLRDRAAAARLIGQLRLTPFARREFEASYESAAEPVERARRFVAMSFMGFGSNAHTRHSTGFRANSNRSGTTPAQDWANFPAALAAIVERLQGVIIESRDAIQVMRAHDGADTLHYVDPPYVHATRCPSPGHHPDYRGYQHELGDDDHRRLIEVLRALSGMVVLSGYPSALYAELLPDWRRETRISHADGARERIECLWINAQACARFDARLPLEPREAAE
jgi:DNA adenine methylase